MGDDTTVKEIAGFKGRIKNLSPAWFGATMGTGMVSILLHQFPFQFRGLEYISEVIWILNIILFLGLTVGSLCRYLMWHDQFIDVLKHPVQSCYLGTFPMGLTTIVSMLCYVAIPKWGDPMLLFTEILFWINTALSFLVCFGVLTLMLTLQPHTIQSFTGVLILPIVTLVVLSATGATLCSVMPPESDALYRTMLGSYAAIAVGFPLTHIILVLYFLRLLIHKWPQRADILSVFLPIGPLGQGSFAIMNLGQMAKRANVVSPLNGEIWASASLLIGLMIWGWALVWLSLALAGLMIKLRKGKIPFNLGWWALTFPVGTFGLSSGFLGEQLDNMFFRVVACIDTVIVVIMWIWVSVKCIQQTWDGRLFFEKGFHESPSKREWKRNMSNAERKDTEKLEGSSDSLRELDDNEKRD